MVKNCLVCGGEFKARPYRVRMGYGKYCTSKCMWKVKKQEYLGNKNPFWGKYHSEEARKKMSVNHADVLGNKNPRFGKHLSEESKKKIGLANKGRIISIKTRKKLSEAHKGDKSHFWKGGIASLQQQIRGSFQYQAWRAFVFQRDSYTCQTCGNHTSGNLNVEHMRPLAVLVAENKILSLEEALICKELWDTNNGKTLCIPCHKKTDSYLNCNIVKEYLDRQIKGVIVHV